MTSQCFSTTATYGYGVPVGQFTGKERDQETGLDNPGMIGWTNFP